MSLFSRNLRFLRKRGQHLQGEISGLVKKQSNTIGNWENQKSEPSLAEMVLLADFFRVSLDDLINKDIEKESPAQTSPHTGVRVQPGVKSYSFADAEQDVVREAGPDAFWLLLRELRQLNDKVDLLVSGLGSSYMKDNSDKSNH